MYTPPVNVGGYSYVLPQCALPSRASTNDNYTFPTGIDQCNHTPNFPDHEYALFFTLFSFIYSPIFFHCLSAPLFCLSLTCEPLPCVVVCAQYLSFFSRRQLQEIAHQVKRLAYNHVVLFLRSVTPALVGSQKFTYYNMMLAEMLDAVREGVFLASLNKWGGGPPEFPSEQDAFFPAAFQAAHPNKPDPEDAARFDPAKSPTACTLFPYNFRNLNNSDYPLRQLFDTESLTLRIAVKSLTSVGRDKSGDSWQWQNGRNTPMPRIRGIALDTAPVPSQPAATLASCLRALRTKNRSYEQVTSAALDLVSWALSKFEIYKSVPHLVAALQAAQSAMEASQTAADADSNDTLYEAILCAAIVEWTFRLHRSQFDGTCPVPVIALLERGYRLLIARNDRQSTEMSKAISEFAKALYAACSRTSGINSDTMRQVLLACANTAASAQHWTFASKCYATLAEKDDAAGNVDAAVKSAVCSVIASIIHAPCKPKKRAVNVLHLLLSRAGPATHSFALATLDLVSQVADTSHVADTTVDFVVKNIHSIMDNVHYAGLPAVMKHASRMLHARLAEQHGTRYNTRTSITEHWTNTICSYPLSDYAIPHIDLTSVLPTTIFQQRDVSHKHHQQYPLPSTQPQPQQLPQAPVQHNKKC